MSKKPTYQELIEEKARDDAVLEAIGEGLIVILDVNKGRKIVYANKVFERITGWKVKEALNKDVVKILPREDKDGNPIPFKERIVTKVLAGKRVEANLTDPFFYIRKDKTRVPVASTISPIVIDDKVVGAVEVFRDISKELAVDKVKTEFASLVSHQMRTPFSTINWHIELLLSGDVGPINPKQKKYLEETYKASQRMVDLINVLLTVSRIERGKTTINKEAVDITELMETILKESESEMRDNDIKLRKVYDKNIPEIKADPKMLSMVFQNLLSNAVKYIDGHKNKEITLKIKKQKNNLLFEITDNGMGIPKEAQGEIFSGFFRAENAKEKDAAGTGLGLYISKSIIDQMNGKIWFESKKGKGTTFYVSLPLNL